MIKGPPYTSIQLGDDSDPGHAGETAVIKPGLLPETIPPAAPGGRILCCDVNIRINRDGVWYYDGSPIRRKELICLFASVLVRDDEGVYWLVTPAEICQVQVDDAPFQAVEAFVAGIGEDQVLSVRTNVDEIVTIDAAHPVRIETDPKTREPSPYVLLREGIEARLSRPAFYDLVGLGVERRVEDLEVFGVWSSGSFFVLGRLDPD